MSQEEIPDERKPLRSECLRRSTSGAASFERLRAGRLGTRTKIQLGWVFALAMFMPKVVPAELVVFTHGSHLKVESFEVVDDKVHLELTTGGRMAVTLKSVARIVDDEIPKVVPPTPEPPPTFDLTFDPTAPVPDVPYGDLIHGAAERHGLNPALLVAVVRAESAFDAQAVSHKGAQGLMQLMPATAERFGLTGTQVFDAAKNIDAGARYLSWLSRRFDGELSHVLAGYNAGEGTVDRYGGVPPYRETRGYLSKIFRELGLPPPETDASPNGESTGR